MRHNLFRVFLFLLGNLMVIWLIRLCFQYAPILSFLLGPSYIIGLLYFPYEKLWKSGPDEETDKEV